MALAYIIERLTAEKVSNENGTQAICDKSVEWGHRQKEEDCDRAIVVDFFLQEPSCDGKRNCQKVWGKGPARLAPVIEPGLQGFFDCRERKCAQVDVPK
jgi:hypothetical protein